MTPVLNVLNTALLASAIGAAVLMFDHMTKKTRDAVRFGALLLFIGAVAQVCGVWMHWEGWTDTLFFGGVSMFLVANIRSPFAVCRPDYSTAEAEAQRRLREKVELASNRGAFIIGGVTLLSVILSWGRL